MAATKSYRVEIDPVDAGMLASSATQLTRTIAINENQPVRSTVIMTTAQWQGLTQYMKLMRAGVGTGTVEAAITALAP